MSDTDSFIDEVTEEVRRDRLFALMRRYGWIAVLAVFVLVGGAAWNEWNKAQKRSAAEDFGDRMLAALETEDEAARIQALGAIDAVTPAGKAVLDMLTASEQVASDPKGAATRLLALADSPDVESIYRQIATLKAVMIPDAGLSLDDRRSRLDGLALSAGLMHLLAEEQLAMLDIEAGDNEAAIVRLRQVILDAGATAGLRNRATQVMVALGGDLLDEQQDEQQSE